MHLLRVLYTKLSESYFYETSYENKTMAVVVDMICLEGPKRLDVFFILASLENEPTACGPRVHYIINFSPNNHQMLGV